jgi:hypothetical protein
MDEVLWLGETDRRLGNDGAVVGQTDSRFLDCAVAVAPATLGMTSCYGVAGCRAFKTRIRSVCRGRNRPAR